MASTTPPLGAAHPARIVSRPSALAADGAAPLAIVLGLAGFFVVFVAFTLDARSLWLDEFLTLETAAPFASFAEAFGGHMTADIHPPLYFTLAHFWMKTFGPEPAGLRSLNLLAVAAFGPLLWAAWRARLMPPTQWFVFSLLLLTSWFAWDFAAEARPYIFSLALATAQVVLLVRFVRTMEAGEGIGWGRAALAGALGLAASYTHYFGFLLTGGFFAATLLPAARGRRWEDVRALLISGLSVAAAMSAWIGVSLTALQNSGGDFWIQKGLLATLAEFFGTAFSVNLPLTACIAAAGVWAAPALWRDPATRAVGLMGAVCFAAAALVSLAAPILYYRYLIVLAPVVFFLSASAIAKAGRPWLTAIAVVAIVSVSLPLAVARSLEPREEWREAAQYFEARWGAACDGAEIMVSPDYFDNMPQSFSGHGYYLTQSRPTFIPFTADGLTEAYLGQACPVVLWAGHIKTRPFLTRTAELGLPGAHPVAGRFDGVHFLVQE